MHHFLPVMGRSVPARTSKPSPSPSLTASFLGNRHQLSRIGFSRSRHLDGVWDAGGLLRGNTCERKGVAVGSGCTAMEPQLISRKLVGSLGMCVLNQSYLVDGHSRTLSHYLTQSLNIGCPRKGGNLAEQLSGAEADTKVATDEKPSC